jgi:hypothetical protein
MGASLELTVASSVQVVELHRCSQRVYAVQVPFGDLGILATLDTLPRHPDALVLPTLPANATVHIRSGGAVLQVITACSCQCGL